MRKGWVEVKISPTVQNAFTPKETEVIAREVSRQDKKEAKIDLSVFFWAYLEITKEQGGSGVIYRNDNFSPSLWLHTTPQALPAVCHYGYQAFITWAVGSGQ